MADYFTNFSLLMPLPDEDARKYALELASAASSAQQGDEPPDNLPDSIREVIEDWQFDAEADQSHDGRGLWLHSDCGGIDAVCAFIRHLLQKFDPQGCVTFEWSNDCSQPRVDAFGGGAAIVTAQEIKTLSTWGWLQEHAPANEGTAS